MDARADTARIAKLAVSITMGCGVRRWFYDHPDATLQHFYKIDDTPGDVSGVREEPHGCCACKHGQQQR